MALPAEHELFHGRYRIRAVLGEGGAGIVYRTTDELSGRDVALKVLKPGPDGYSDSTIARFEREVKILGTLRDPHTVTMHDVGRSEEGYLFIVFEFIEGRDLEDLIFASGGLPEQTVLHVLMQLLASLQEAHDAGLLHRDLKPANIRIFEYMGDPYHAKVIDFGIAKTAQPLAGARQITQDGSLVGTPNFMAPEQIRSQPLSPATDVYALGLVVIEMLTGEPAVTGESAVEVLGRQASDEPIELPRALPISPGFRSTVERMVRKDPRMRFQSAGDVRGALLASGLAPHPSGSGPIARRPSELSGRAVPRTLREPPPQDAPTQDGRATTIAVVSAGLAIGGLAVAALLLFSPEDEPPPPPPPVVVDTAPEEFEPVPAAHAERPVDLGAPAAVDLGGNDQIPDGGSSGCLEPVDPQTDWQSFAVDALGQRRRAYLKLPPSDGGQVSRPVIFLFQDHSERHPGGHVQFARESGFDELAEREGAVLLALEPFHTVDLSRGLAGVRIQPWPDAAVDFVRGALKNLAARTCIEEDRVFAVGQGLGADFLTNRGCGLSFTAVAVNGFRSPTVCTPRAPMIRFDGESDRFLPTKGGVDCHGRPTMAMDAHLEMLRGARCGKDGVKWEAGANGVECRRWACEAALVSCVHENGHEWPGAEFGPGEPTRCPGPNMDFDAASVVWRFFEQEGSAGEDLDP